MACVIWLRKLQFEARKDAVEPENLMGVDPRAFDR